ncbi:CaiB/BaiF CoA-transferase family protein [soil metagenome]
MVRPLDGVRVLDLTRVLAGPHATRALADLGADIIKVEPPAGDLTRFATPRINGLATYFVQQNVGKRNVSIDLTTPRGVELVAELADRSDVLVENFRTGVLHRLGLGQAELRARNPRLIYASSTGYGATGPWVHRRAYAPVVAAESGLTKAQGDARAAGPDGGGVYANDPQSHADVYTAKEITIAVLAALYERERTGQGEWIDISMAETMLYVNEHLHDQLWDGPDDPQWIRSFAPGDYLVFTVGDGAVLVVSGHPAERGTFELFLRALDVEHLADDARFADVASRQANFDDLRALLLDAAGTIPDASTFEERFAAHRLASGQLRTARELAETPWAAARGAVVTVSDRDGGTLRLPNAPWHFSDAEVGVRGEPRYRGEDNRSVLVEVLGYDEATIDALEADGVLSSRVPGRPGPDR